MCVCVCVCVISMLRYVNTVKKHDCTMETEYIK